MTINRLNGMILSFTIILIFFSYLLGIYIFEAVNSVQVRSVLNSFLIFNDSEYGTYYILCQIASFLPLSALIVFYFFKSSYTEDCFGNAHFANYFEIMKGDFFSKKPESIIVGKKYGVPIYSNGFEHVLCFAPSGSGKTRSIAMPNLYMFPFSVVCNDVKLTLYDKTAKYREESLGNKCFVWAPSKRHGITHGFNPLDLISTSKNYRMMDIQRISHILIPDPKSGDPIWSRASRKLFKTLVLYLLDTPEKPVTLGEINRLIKRDSFNDWLYGVLAEVEGYDPAFYENGFSYINNHEKTRDSILETFSGYFELFDDPIVDKATSKSDFDITKLRKEKMTIYVGFTDDDMERLSPIINMFWQQLISVMIQEVPNLDSEPYPLLCLIDEFASLGRIERLRRSLKLLREYRVRCVLMMQYLAQTMEQYTPNEAKAFTNIKTKISFSTDDMDDAKYISEILGKKTIKVHSRTTSFQERGNGSSQNTSYQAVPLMLPDEIVKISREDGILMKTGSYPIQFKKILSQLKHIDRWLALHVIHVIL